jgi:RNA polymerase sigma factor (sigma-70 family)
MLDTLLTLDQTCMPRVGPRKDSYNVTIFEDVPVNDIGKTETLSPQTAAMIAVKRSRDKAAFASLFDYFAPRLKGFVMRSGVSSAAAEEIVQEVMLTVWHKADLFDPGRAQVSAWIYQIARNRLIDRVRKDRRPMPEELKAEPDQEPSSMDILEMDQEVSKLKAAIQLLSPDQRDIIERAYLGEFSHQQISTQTGLPLGTIKSRIRLGLDRLRRELKDIR